jgi:hypothetical protein
MGIRTRHFMVRIQEYLNSGSETDGSCPLLKINRKDLKIVVTNDEMLKTNCTVRFENKHLQNHNLILIPYTNNGAK